MFCFSTIQELYPILDKNISITFAEQINHPNSLAALTYEAGEVKIEISTSRFGKIRSLESQQHSLVHEFVHLFQLCTQGYTPTIKKPDALGEKLINLTSSYLIKYRILLLDALMSELILRPNCSFAYHSYTPFFHYHQACLKNWSLEENITIFDQRLLWEDWLLSIRSPQYLIQRV